MRNVLAFWGFYRRCRVDFSLLFHQGGAIGDLARAAGPGGEAGPLAQEEQGLRPMRARGARGGGPPGVGIGWLLLGAS